MGGKTVVGLSGDGAGEPPTPLDPLTPLALLAVLVRRWTVRGGTGLRWPKAPRGAVSRAGGKSDPEPLKGSTTWTPSTPASSERARTSRSVAIMSSQAVLAHSHPPASQHGPNARRYLTPGRKRAGRPRLFTSRVWALCSVTVASCGHSGRMDMPRARAVRRPSAVVAVQLGPRSIHSESGRARRATAVARSVLCPRDRQASRPILTLCAIVSGSWSGCLDTGGRSQAACGANTSESRWIRKTP